MDPIESYKNVDVLSRCIYLQFFNTLGSIVQIAGLWKLALEAQE
jgi:hypothetical protein